LHITKNLCKKLDIVIQGLLTGEELRLLTDQQLKILAQETNLFCRVTPDQKGRIIRILKSNGYVVGFLGDGINDVPALYEADVGISVENAVDVAKEAANFILLERTLTVVHKGVLEGRHTFANILKYIMMGTSSNLGNMISMVAASLFLPFLPMLPIQILLNNLLYDLSEIAIPFDHVDAEQLDMPSKWNISFIKKFMLVLGPLSSLFDFCLFYILFSFFKADASFFQTGWFLGSLATQILVIFIIRTKRNPFKSRPHPYLIISSLGALTLGMLLPWSPFSSLFEFEPLPFSFLTTLFILVCVYLFLAGITKQFFYKKSQSL
ncbi:MAG: magnesium-translocating P-type ATPase, partial [Alphaproteobacteria bacterium]|nr:magnesium-translocating P-type ATPase [Alphaproteobacteria bacterium]